MFIIKRARLMIWTTYFHRLTPGLWFRVIVLSFPLLLVLLVHVCSVLERALTRKEAVCLPPPLFVRFCCCGVQHSVKYHRGIVALVTPPLGILVRVSCANMASLFLSEPLSERSVNSKALTRKVHTPSPLKVLLFPGPFIALSKLPPCFPCFDAVCLPLSLGGARLL